MVKTLTFCVSVLRTMRQSH